MTKKKKSVRPFLPWLIGTASIAFLVGVILFNFIVMPAFVHKGKEVTVPDLVGHSLQEAENALFEQSLALGKQTTAHSSSVPKGFVISQNPQPKALVKRGRKVSVVASLGEQWASVPELSNENLRRAEILIRKAGLRMGSISYTQSDSIAKDLIVASEPAAGGTVPLDSDVNLLLSLGPYQAATSVPDLRGLQVSEAESKANGLGFVVVVKSPAGKSSGKSKVYDQKPRPGFEASAGDTVELIVGK